MEINQSKTLIKLTIFLPPLLIIVIHIIILTKSNILHN